MVFVFCNKYLMKLILCILSWGFQLFDSKVGDCTKCSNISSVFLRLYQVFQYIKCFLRWEPIGWWPAWCPAGIWCTACSSGYRVLCCCSLSFCCLSLGIKPLFCSLQLLFAIMYFVKWKSVPVVFSAVVIYQISNMVSTQSCCLPYTHTLLFSSVVGIKEKDTNTGKLTCLRESLHV